jgi:FkbM family methyltransferase
MKSVNSKMSYADKVTLGIQNHVSALYGAKRLGFTPTSVIDIGAHNGDWTTEVRELFPDPQYLLFEPLPTKKDLLKEKFRKTNTEIYSVLLGHDEKREVPFFSMGTGSSVLEEQTSLDREVIFLDMCKLDSITCKHNLGDKVLMKIDVQGFELEVLKGAEKTLSFTELILMEVSLLNYNKEAPLIHQVIPAMEEYGFVPYDFVGFIRKANDNALIQTDMFFVKKDSKLRRSVNRFDQEEFGVIAS